MGSYCKIRWYSSFLFTPASSKLAQSLEEKWSLPVPRATNNPTKPLIVDLHQGSAKLSSTVVYMCESWRTSLSSHIIPHCFNSANMFRYPAQCQKKTSYTVLRVRESLGPKRDGDFIKCWRMEIKRDKNYSSTLPRFYFLRPPSTTRRLCHPERTRARPVPRTPAATDADRQENHLSTLIVSFYVSYSVCRKRTAPRKKEKTKVEYRSARRRIRSFFGLSSVGPLLGEMGWTASGRWKGGIWLLKGYCKNAKRGPEREGEKKI